MVEQKTILVFSDDFDSQQLIRACANSREYQVLFKEKKRDVLRVLITQKFDLIIDEIQKPLISEIDFFDSVYKMANGTPISIVSEYFYETRNIVFTNKPAVFILKPLTLEKIIDLFDEFFETKVVDELLLQSEPLPEFTIEARKLSVLLEISKKINLNKNLDDLLITIIDILTETLDAERATLFMVDKEKNELWSRIGTRIKSKEIRFPASDGIAGWVAKTGISQIIDDAYYHPKFSKEIDNQTGFITKNILCVPIKNHRGEVIGVFELLNKKNGLFNKSDEEFLNILAVNVGISIDNAIAHHKLERQNKELKQSYDEMYVTQAALSKQIKNETINQIQKYFTDESINTTIIKKLEELSLSKPDDPIVRDNINNIVQSIKDSNKKINSFFESIKKR
jgi:CheY-like chemotaxis protein